MKKVGAHVSIRGGVQNAPLNAEKIGATAFALFTKNQRRWEAPPLEEKAIEAFKTNCAGRNYKPENIVVHDSYLINLGHPGKNGLKKSRKAFFEEMHRCGQLGLTMLVFHPGNHLNKISEEKCLETIAESVNMAVKKYPAVTAVIENSAGQGTSVGYSFEQLARIIELVENKDRVGVCIDTCHAFAAGFDLSDPDQFDAIFDKFDGLIGMKYLKAMHLNDSKRALASRVDRHACLGEGKMGRSVFKWIMKDKRFEKIPLILETPDSDRWAEEVEFLLANIY